ncbi:MAG TPA: GFA family protein [Sphingomicrobium sp.]|nr:GFA family protein [Sphingomicrobium sp.]
MTARTASCRCGQLKATATGDPVRVSVCHCLNCKKRCGSAFAVQARWPKAQVTIDGASKTFVKVADSGNRATFHFCPDCGSDVYYEIDGKFDDKFNDLVAIPLGAFDDPWFASPAYSVWEERKHDWVEISGDQVEHLG